MSIPWQECESTLVQRALIEVIERLRAPPDDLTTIPNPIIDDSTAYNSALIELSAPTALYGASFGEPTAEWSSRTLEWTRSGSHQPDVARWASQALSEGVFDSQAWFDALADSGNTVLRDILIHWGRDDLKVCSCHLSR